MSSVPAELTKGTKTLPMRDNGRQSDDVFRHEHEIVIEAGRTELLDWLDLWHYRELFWVLARRDLAVRYNQTAIGAYGRSCGLCSQWWSSPSYLAGSRGCLPMAQHRML